MKTERISGEGKSFTAERRRFELARNRDEAKRGMYRVFEMIAGIHAMQISFTERAFLT